MSDEEKLADLLDQYMDLSRKGQAPAPADFAATYPDCAEELTELIESVQSISKTAQSAEAATLDIPKRFDDYVILEKIGQGGMGAVYRAKQISLNRFVAVKFLSPVWSSDPVLRQRFDNEARLIALLDHPNIVKVYGAGHEKELCYYVMQLIEGAGLNRVDFEKAFPGEKRATLITKVGLQAARALAYAHEHGILHRDIKPDNLLLDAEGVLHISDFGIATLLSEQGTLLTQSQCGTLKYMSPERLMKNESHFTSDQYALALTLYELLQDKPVYENTPPGMLVRKICAGPLPLLKNVDNDLSVIIAKALSFHASQRYTTMRDFADDLDRYLHAEPICARPVNMFKRFMLWCRRSPVSAALTLLSVMLTFGLLIAVSISNMRISNSLQNEASQRRVAETRRREAVEQRALAESNAAVASETLKRIFERFSPFGQSAGNGTMNTENAKLLNELLPYYSDIAREQNLPDSQLREANEIVAYIAECTDNYDLALSTLLNLRAGATDTMTQIHLNERITTIYIRRGNFNEAKNRLLAAADVYLNSDNLDEQLYALRSTNTLLGTRLSGSRAGTLPQQDRERLFSRAMPVATELLELHPNNPDVLFMFASIIGKAISLSDAENQSVNETSLRLLRALISEYPARADYRLEYLYQVWPLSLEGADYDLNLKYMTAALFDAEALLEQKLFTTEVVSMVLSIRYKFMISSIKHGNIILADRLYIQILTLLQIRMPNSESPEALRGTLIEISLAYAKILLQKNILTSAAVALGVLVDELPRYNGPSRARFEHEIQTIMPRHLQQPPDDAPNTQSGPLSEMNAEPFPETADTPSRDTEEQISNRP